MKKKLLSKLFLLLAILGGVNSAWADDVIFLMENPTAPATSMSSGATETVIGTFSPNESSAEVHNGKSSAVVMVQNNQIKLGGSGSSWFHAILTSAISEGDIITSSDESKTYYIAPTSSKPKSAITFPYTVPSGSSFIGMKDVYVWKADGNAFSSFTVTRPVGTQKPVISLSGSTVTLSCSTSGSTIYYTTDGVEPTTSSAIYSSSFTLDNSCTVRAFAKKDDDVSELVKKDCYVSHPSAQVVLGYNGGTVSGDVWTSTDGLYVITNNVAGRGIGYTNLAGSQDGFKINHTDNYTLKVSDDIKVTKIVVVGKTWLQGNSGNASTLKFDGFTPSSSTFFDYPTDGETYIKTLEFTPESELGYGATITMRPGNNQIGMYIELYGEKRNGPADPVEGESIKEVAKIASGGTCVSTVTPSGTDPIISTSGNTNNGSDYLLDGYSLALKLESNSGSINIALPNGTNDATVTLLSKKNDVTSLKLNGTTQSVTWTGDVTSGYTTTLDIKSYAGSTLSITKGSGSPFILQITVDYTIGVANGVILTTTANMAGWRSFYDASNEYSVDSNTKVYVADSDPVNDMITLKEIAGVPDGVPVILHTTSSADNYKMTLTKAVAGTYSYEGTNKLAVTDGTAVTSVYRLGYGANGMGFYPYSATSPESGIVYLNVSSSAARTLRIAFADDATGVNTIENGERIMDHYFDLQGRRVAQPQKGLYIVNGKKVVVK